jgi:hypothetical protein
VLLRSHGINRSEVAPCGKKKENKENKKGSIVKKGRSLRRLLPTSSILA